MGALADGIRVAVIAAMRPELRPIVERLDLRCEALGSGQIWRGRAGRREVVAAVTSMGTAAAARWTRGLLDAHPVDHVVVVGIAGGVDPALRIGDLLDPETVVDERSGAALHPAPLRAEAPRGRLLTTDTLHNTPAAVEALRSQGVGAVDMETAAIAAVAEARAIPWSVLRAVSDYAGDPRIDEAVVGLSRPDGSPDWSAVARFVLTRPRRAAMLPALGRGMRRAVRVSTEACLRALDVAPRA